MNSDARKEIEFYEIKEIFIWQITLFSLRKTGYICVLGLKVLVCLNRYFIACKGAPQRHCELFAAKVERMDQRSNPKSNPRSDLRYEI